jgi:predicted  nucleic acid-binding Zn-ribbon protein
MLVSCAYLRPQHISTAKLSEAEIEEIRENGVFPDLRIKSYTKFVEQRAMHIKSLTGRPKSAQRVLQLDSGLQDLTALMDELGSNLDQYSDRHADLRKSLKELSEASSRWVKILRSLPGESGFDVSRKEAIESGEELADQASRLLKEQTEYFATHKEEKGQERGDPALEAKPQ